MSSYTINPTDSRVYSLPKCNNKARAKTTGSDTGSVTLTRPDPTKIVDPMTRDPKTRFQPFL